MYYGQRYEAVLAAVDYDDIQNIPDFQYDTFTGPGTSFTLTTGSPKDVAALDVTIDGVTQKPGVDYSVTNLASGTQIAFSSSLEAGEKALVVYRAIPGSSQTLAYTEQFTAVQNDSTPVLGGDLNLNQKRIISALNTDLKIEVGAGGKLKLNDLAFPSADGTSGQFLMTDGVGAITWQTPPGAVGGEANTASNAGTNQEGTGLFKQKSNVNFEFKRLIAGDGIVISEEENLIKIRTPDYTINRTDYGFLNVDYGDLGIHDTVQDFGFISTDEAVNLEEVLGLSAGLQSPSALTNSGYDERLFIAEQTGKIKVYKGSTVLSTPFLDLNASNISTPPFHALATTYDERGLLGLAFDPNFNTNGWFYINYSTPKAVGTHFPYDGIDIDHETIIARYTVTDPANDDVADPTSGIVVMRFDQPASNHNGGYITFGPDGYMYIGTGDGGAGPQQPAPEHNSQGLETVLGKILRIDVSIGSQEYGNYSIPSDNPFKDHATTKEEIFALGFRNPFGMSVDHVTGKCWVGDVGQLEIEEISIAESGKNYGWNLMEGSLLYDVDKAIEIATAAGTDVETYLNALERPVAEYPHEGDPRGINGLSIIGGFVYRGSVCTELYGKYVFGDWTTDWQAPNGELYYLRENVEFNSYIIERLNPLAIDLGVQFITGFGEDVHKELYIITRLTYDPTGAGRIYKLVGQTIA
jgi:glucose/arabinose dehydrogenase